jgi:hypothetical protein
MKGDSDKFFCCSSRWDLSLQSSASLPKRSPLACLLRHWKDLDPDNLKRKTIIFLYAEAWLQHPLGDQKKWTSESSLNFNTILQLDLFCKCEEKWTEIP